MMKIQIVVSAALAVAMAPMMTVAEADTVAHHIRGTVAAVDRDRVTIATAHGSVVVMLTAKTRIAGVEPGEVSDVKNGTFIGTANVPGNGVARALEVVVFPKSMAGTGEGDYPWDLPAGGGAMSAMTNGTVMKPKMSAMTNATVTHVTGGAMQTVSLSYKGGTKVVAIPPGAPVVRVVPATKALVVVGAHVFVAPPASATPFVIVGEKGAIPPM